MKRRNPTRADAAVIARTAKSTGHTTFSIRYRDANRALAWERLGTDAEGWTRAAAKAELEARLVDVAREGLVRPGGITFGELAEQWLATYPTSKRLKRSTREGYETIVKRHVTRLLGDLPVSDLDVAELDRFVAEQLEAGLSPASVNRQLNVISLIVKSGRKRGLMKANPVELVDRPPEARRRWKILTPAEIKRVRVAFAQLAADADDVERAWFEQAAAVFAVVYGIGLRRGEILGLRWHHVRLADPAGPTLRVEETFVRHQVDTPKSDASTRTLALGRIVADVLFEHRARTAYGADGDRVFVHPLTGGSMCPKNYADRLRLALAKAEVEGRVRPFHDGRHGHLTNAAAAGVAPTPLQAVAGHADFSTTKRYIDLAGIEFRAEATLAEQRMFGPVDAPE
jgi:integrase